MFRGRWRCFNNMILKPTNKLKKAFQNLSGYSNELSLASKLIEKDKTISDINTDTGDGCMPCSVREGINIGSKECIRCKYCYGCDVKILTTYKNTVKGVYIVKCNSSRGTLYKFFTRYIIRQIKLITNKLITYNVKILH